ncbi:MAG: hypothetical protein Q7T07_12525 [Burkholderiaceae bacterium]|nr:hypothetical protein [Burkholderiaceae bacterium]
MMDIEFTRMAIVYLHLIACCVAIGLVLTSDIAMVKQLLRADASEKIDSRHLSDLQKTVSRALIALWITGAGIIALDVSLKGLAYFGNPKLQSKVAIVMLLTLNGFVLHKYVMPLLQQAGSLLKLSLSQRMVAIFAGALSGVSWFYAAMLGIGRPLNWKYSLVEILAAYPVLIVGGFASMVLLTAWSQRKTRAEGKVRTGGKVADVKHWNMEDAHPLYHRMTR